MNEALEALAVRCEQAAEPDRELNADILEALADDRWRKLEYEASLPCSAPPDIRTEARYKAGIRFDFTASLDAALTLVPEGQEWAVSKGEYASVGVVGIIDDKENVATAKTPALALCAAALRACAAQA